MPLTNRLLLSSIRWRHQYSLRRTLTNKPKRQRSYSRVLIIYTIPLALATAGYAWYSVPFREYLKEKHSYADFLWKNSDEEDEAVVESAEEKQKSRTVPVALPAQRAGFIKQLKKDIAKDLQDE